MIPDGLVVLTDRRMAARPLLDVVRATVDGGARWVVLRDRDLRYGERRALADALREMLPPGQLIVAGPDPLGGDVVHLDNGESFPRGSLSRLRIGRSCHNADEVHRLSIEDYATLSPVYLTETRPGYGPALTPSGAAGFNPPVPWLAMGGIVSAERVRECAAAGAAGVAVLGAIMRSGDPAQVTRDLVDAWAEATPRPGH